MANHTEQQQPRFIKLNHVRSITALSTSEIYRRIAAGTFPAQITLGPKSVVWLESEVVAWCESRIAENRNTCQPVWSVA